MKKFIFFNSAKTYFLLLFILAVCIGIFRLHYYDWPPNRDITEYALTTHELLSGQKLYSDVWNPKPPAIFISYGIAEILFGYGPLAIYAMNLVFTLITLAGVYAAAVASGFGPPAGILAAFFWTLLSGDISLQLQDPNTETFINAFLIWGFVLFVAPPNKSFSYSRAVAIGLLFAWASFYKHVVVAIAFMLSVAHIAMPPRGTSRKKAMVHILIIAGIGIICWGGLFAYMAATGRFQIFYDTIFTHGLDYAWGASATIGAGANQETAATTAAAGVGQTPDISSAYSFLAATVSRFQVLIPMIIFSLTGILYALIKQRTKAWVLIVMYAIGSFISIAMPGKFYRHYFQLGIPCLVVACACVTVMWLRTISSKKAIIPYLVVLLICLFIAVHQIPYYTSGPEKLLKGTYAERYLTARNLGRKIASAFPDKKMFHWGMESGLYYYSRKRPQGQILGWSLWSNTFGEQFTRETMEDLEKFPPDFIVLSRFISHLHPEHQLYQWIFSNYCEEKLLTEDEKKYFSLMTRCD